VIVISGGLVLVAIALLIGGLASSGLALVWASIAVSLLSAVFLAVGVYQRRNETPGSELTPAAGPASGDSADGVRTVTATATADEPAESDGLTDEAVIAGGTVYVVVGRPRYHVEGCRYLAGKDSEERDVAAALDEGYSPCGVCKPDAALATLGATFGDESAAPVETVDEPVDEPASVLSDEPVTLTKAPAKKTAAAAKKAPAKKSAAAPMVVAVVDRGKFHRSECRFAGAAGAEEMTKAAAKRKGLVACGVCKP
jgi:hypothetical protein